MRLRSVTTSKLSLPSEVNSLHSSRQALWLASLLGVVWQGALADDPHSGVWATALGDSSLHGMVAFQNADYSGSNNWVAEHPYQDIPEEWALGLPVIRWGPNAWRWYLEAQIPADTKPPSLSLNGANPMTIIQGVPYLEPGATATDDVDGPLDSQIRISGIVDVHSPGEYRVDYEVSDAQGNKASQSRRVIVEASAPPRPPEMRFRGGAATGSVVLELLAPAGSSLILETGTRLGDWAEFQRLSALGENTPVAVTLPINPADESRFWRVRRL